MTEKNINTEIEETVNEAVKQWERDYALPNPPSNVYRAGILKGLEIAHDEAPGIVEKWGTVKEAARQAGWDEVEAPV